MSLTAMWTHGNSIVVETPASFSSILRAGFGTDMMITAGQQAWTHAAIPTPAILRGKRPKLLRVIILFKTSSARLKEIHLFDSNNRIHEKQTSQGGSLLVQGDFNTFALPSPREISFALGISMRWTHEIAGASAQPQQVFIAAVGADFEIAD